MTTHDATDAWTLLKQAEAAPSDPAAWLKAAQALARIGQKAASEQAFERYVDLAPGRRALSNGAKLHQAGDLHGALRLYREALQADARNVDALRLFALASSLAGERGEAIQAARQAVSLAPNHPSAWDALGTVLSDSGMVEDAVQAFLRLAALAPQSPASHAKLAHALVLADETASAEKAYRTALQLRPDDALCLVGLGAVLRTIGKQDEAIACFKRCLAIHPRTGEAWWNLANLKTYRFSDEDIAAMRRLLADPATPPASRVNATFALGKALEDARSFDEAFTHYRQAAKMHRATLRYDADGVESLTTRIIGVFTPAFAIAHKGNGCGDPAPIFVVGMPRSGSTLIEQILASHSQVDGADEISVFGKLLNELNCDGLTYPEVVTTLAPADFKALGEAYLARAARYRRGRPFFVDKTPQNFGSIGPIALALPNAKIIDARRHPMDSCFGSFKQLFAQGQNYSYDLAEMGHFYLQYERLMDHWDQALPGKVLRVDYEDVVLDQERQTRRLLEYCGLPFEEGCLRFHETSRAVNTASSEQVRQPIYKGSLGAWRRFAPHLTDLQRQLAPSLARLPPHVRDAGLH